MAGGGAERVILEVSRYLALRHYDVDLVLRNCSGPLLHYLPCNVNLFAIHPPPSSFEQEEQCPISIDKIGWVYESKKLSINDHLRAVVRNWPLGLKVIPRRKNRYVTQSNSLAKYFLERKPDVVMSVLPHDYFCSLIGLKISRLSIPIICSLRNIVATHSRIHYMNRDKQILAKLLKQADWVHTISEGIMKDVVADGFCSRNQVSTIYNPAVLANIENLVAEPVSHRWISEKQNLKHKIILSVGNLKAQKAHHTLVRAFANVVRHCNVKLLILGEGSERRSLESLIQTLNLSDYVSLPGWTRNPYAFMNHCDVFVLSSEYEGFGNVIIEALQCGCNIVSTDCRHGPREILKHGEFGTLVPVGDVSAMSEGILQSLETEPNRKKLQTRANDFAIDKIGPQFERLFRDVASGQLDCCSNQY